MSSRLDGIQVAVPRTVDSAQQQHVAQRLPAVAQEQATATARHEARERELRPNELRQRGHAGAARDDLIPPLVERDPRRRSSSSRRQPGTRTVPVTAGFPSDSDASERGGTAIEGVGSRVDVRL